MKYPATFRTFRSLASGSLGALMVIPLATFAANPKPQTESGTIKTVDATTHTLVVTDLKDKKEHQFQWNDQSKFSLRGKAVAATELKPGERIHITYESTGDRPTIERARLAPAKPEKAPSASHHAPKSAGHEQG